MATVSNKSLNTATATNKGKGTDDLTWDDATWDWDSAGGTWNNPHKMENKTLNTASVTNKTIS